jgi:hypothetical protein
MPSSATSQRLDDVAAVRDQPGAVQLEHREPRVEVGDHAGQAVAFAVDQPAAIGVPVAERHVGAPQRHGSRDAPPPEERADRLGGIARQHAHRDGRERVEVPARHELPALDHVDDGAGLQAGRRLLQRALVDPRVPRAQVSRQVLGQLDLHGHGPH